MLLDDSSSEFQNMIFAVQNRMAGGVPDKVVANANHESYRKLCEETESWVLTILHTVSASQTLYSAVGNTDANVRRIISVKIRQPGDGRSFNDIPRIEDDSYDKVQNGILFRQYKRIEAYNGCPLEIKSAVVPTRSTPYIDSDIYESYANAIEYGAIMTLASQINRPWYSENMFGMYRNEFFTEISRILSDTASGLKNNTGGFEG